MLLLFCQLLAGEPRGIAARPAPRVVQLVPPPAPVAPPQVCTASLLRALALDDAARRYEAQGRRLAALHVRRLADDVRRRAGAA